MDPIILGFFEDFSFILKLAFIIFVVVFVKERITKNWLAITAIVAICIVLIFFYWPVFGSMYVIYILISIGIGSVLVDTFFVTMGEGQKGQGPDPQQMLGQGQQPEQDFDYSQYQDMINLKRAGQRRR